MDSPFKNKMCLTPSKASTLEKGIYSFLKSYILKEKPEDSSAMEKGRILHEVFYSILKEGDDNKISYFPSFPTKAEYEKTHNLKKGTGLTQKEQKEAFVKQEEIKGNIILNENLKPVVESIKIFVQTEKINVPRGTLFEVALEDESVGTGGIIDILGSNFIIDVKTTSKPVEPNEFGKYNYRNFAIQQVIYQDLAFAHKFEIKNFYFIAIQTEYPYQISSLSLPKDYVGSVSRYFNSKILPLYKKLIKKTKGLEKKEGETSLAVWKRLNKAGLYKPKQIKQIEIPAWEKSSLYRETLKYERQAVKTISRRASEKDFTNYLKKHKTK